MDTAPTEVLGYAARAAVAGTFLFSAAWKLRHPGQFRVAFRAATPRRLHRLDRPAARLVPAVEAVVAVALLASWPAGPASSLAALLVLLVFTLALLRSADPRAGCGCWRSTGHRTGRGPYLVRNGLLIGLALAGVLVSTSPPLVAVPFGLVAGGVVAVILMELPGISEVAFG
jgi:Methylamine utilisation protein MauE